MSHLISAPTQPASRAEARHGSPRLRSPLLRSALAALLAVTVAVPASARPVGVMDEVPAAVARHISMGVGKSTIIELPQDAAEIFVGNPAVASAVVRTARKIYVIGTASGQTSLYAMDKNGRQIAAFEINIGRDVGELSQILKLALPTANIMVRTVNDTIILTGTVDSAEDATRASDLAKGFSKQLGSAGANAADGMVVNSLNIRGRDQVMLKVTVAEMRRDVAKQLGITSSNWGALQQYNTFGINGPLSNNTTGGNFVNSPVAIPQTSAVNIATNSLQATLQAFERYGVTRTLAEPTVTAVSGESAKFTVGGEFPYSTGLTCSAASTGTGVSTSSQQSTCTAGAGFKPYGITLNFEPIVMSEGRILLHLSTEVADLDYQHAVTIGGAPTPGLLTRKNDTTIELPSGGSIASAGLIQQKSQQVINGMPGLLNIPILGTLFRSRDYQRSETELIIIVTPIIVKPVNANALARPDDGFVDATDPQAWLLGRMNRITALPRNAEAARNYRGRVGFIQD